MNYNIYFNYAAMVIVMILLSIYLIRPRFINLSAKIFQVLVACVFIASITEMMTCVIIENPTKVPMFLNYFVIGIFLYSINICSILYYRYVVEITVHEKVKKWEHRVFLFALIFDFIIIALSPFTNLVVYFDENNVYKHGPLFYALYVVAFFVLIIAGIKFFCYRKKLNQIQRFSVIFFYIVNVGAILFERLYPEINILTFVTALYMFLLYVSLQNPEYYVDYELGCYNQEAFIKVCEEKSMKSNKYVVISFYVDGYEYVNQVFGMDRGIALTKHISNYFIQKFNYDNFFHISDSNFVYISSSRLDRVEKMYKKVWNDFNKIYEINNAKISLQPRGCAILVPNVVHKAKDILDAVFFSQNKELPNINGELYYLDSEFLQKKHRKEHIVQMIKEKILIQAVEVLYLPIYDVKEKQIIGAEALVRMYDEVFDEIQQEEFITIAEEYGLILELDQAIFSKVCQFIHFMELRDYDIKSIEVNLSTIEIMQGESTGQWLDVLKKNKVNPKKINFEIKESVCFALQENLVKNMRVLREEGCNFSVDNYGTGISNMTDLLKLEFDMIKIDKLILWEAMKTKEAMCVFESMIMMFKKLGYEVLAAGVETKEQQAVVKRLKIDYMQGKIISKQVNEKGLLELLKKNRI